MFLKPLRTPPGIALISSSNLGANFAICFVNHPINPPESDNLANSAAASVLFPALDSFITPFNAFAEGLPAFKAYITGLATISPA